MNLSTCNSPDSFSHEKTLAAQIISGNETTPFFGFLGAAAALVFSCMGAAYGTTKSSVGVASMGLMRPELVMKSIVPVVMAGVLGIYGLIIDVISVLVLTLRLSLTNCLMDMRTFLLDSLVVLLAWLLVWPLALSEMLVSGPTLNSLLLKSTQGYDHSMLDTISVFKDIGANVGVLSGILYFAVNHSGSRSYFRRPWVVHATGAIQCFEGYLLLWFAVTRAIPWPQVSVMCLFMFLAAHAQTFFNTAKVVTAVQNFRNYSGTIVDI